MIFILIFFVCVIVGLGIYFYKKTVTKEETIKYNAGKPVQSNPVWLTCKDHHGKTVDWSKSKKIVDNINLGLYQTYYTDKPWYDPSRLWSKTLNYYKCPSPPDGKLVKGYWADIDHAKQTEKGGADAERVMFDYTKCKDNLVDLGFVKLNPEETDPKKIDWRWKYRCHPAE